MAQAARLNLRMQKELKLLITDPPPGAAFPSLSSSSTSLSSIDAQIEGPEGSVYEKGVFKLKIQIPERYPFQPPIVTFLTPIYHPNIDTGGRICLDILNLPPKGAWQPSLNISTVLTSIGLLLSEPNPDDGLMHEASREYKYDRQVFDQKARSMTEKHANVGATEVESVAHGSSLANPSIQSPEAKGSDISDQDNFVSHKRLCGVSRKLSLEASESDQKRNDAKIVNEASNLYDRHEEIMGLEQEPKAILIVDDKTDKDLQGTKKKLSLELLVPAKMENDDNINVMPTSSISQPQPLSMDAPESWPLMQPGFSSQPNPHVDKDSQSESNSRGISLERDLQKPLALWQGTGEDDKKLCFGPRQSAVLFSSSGSQETPLWVQTSSHQNERESHRDVVDGHGKSFSRVKHKKLGLSGRRLPGEQLGWNQSLKKDNKENFAPNSSFLLSHIQKNPMASSVVPETGDCNYSVQISTNSSHRPAGTKQRNTPSPHVESNDMKSIELQMEMESECPSRPRHMQNDSCNYKKQQLKDYGERFAAGERNREDVSSSADAVIVLDSEDSGEEQSRTARSQLSLARRRLPRKRKS